MDHTHPKTAGKPLSLEDRLAPKIDQAEYLLVLVIAFMLWTAGFVDLFTHTSQDRSVLGLYSVPYFGLLLAYSLGFLFWIALIFPRDSLTWVKNGIHFVQQRAWLGIAVFAVFVAILASMLGWERWLSFPLLEASVALLILLAGTVILVARPKAGVQVQAWRGAILYLLAALIAVEVLLQALSFLRVLPVNNTSGLFTHRGRVYQNDEGFTNGRTNRYGFYYPEFRLEDGSRRIVVTGDTYITALQVKPEENLGVLLEERLARDSDAEPPAEVLGLGVPGYGPGLYLDVLLYPYTMEPLKPDEVIVFFHLANDFQTVAGPHSQVPYYRVGENGQVEIHPDDFFLRHDLQHVIIRGFEPVNPVRTALSYLFTFNLVDGWVRNLFGITGRVPLPPENIESADSSNPFGASSFVFRLGGGEEAGRAVTIAVGLLEQFKRQLDSQGVRMRLVTIPYFPAEFYSRYRGAGWEGRLGEYDLLLPERALEEFALEQDIPFLPMGQYMRAKGTTVEAIKDLFFKEGTGHFTPAGHAYFAEAVYACFYGPDGDCPVR